MTIRSTVSAQQRYRNAITKARRIARRNLDAFLGGRADSSGTPGYDIERDCIIDEFERLHAEIARAREAATIAERERCAHVARAHVICDWDNPDPKKRADGSFGMTIAAAILGLPPPRRHARPPASEQWSEDEIAEIRRYASETEPIAIPRLPSFKGTS